MHAGWYWVSPRKWGTVFVDGFEASLEREDTGSRNGAMESDNQRGQAERIARVFVPLLRARVVQSLLRQYGRQNNGHLYNQNQNLCAPKQGGN